MGLADGSEFGVFDDADARLDNPIWAALTTNQRDLAEVAGRARRYRTDVSVFGAVDEVEPESWDDLAELAGPDGEVGLLRDEIPPAPHGWDEVVRGTGHQMVLGPSGLAPVDHHEIRRLTDDDLPAILHLIGLTLPGPFLAGTIRTGRYFGHWAEGRLLAMAGERFHPPGFTEVSAVCTHPDARHRGLGSAITHRVASAILDRGEQPFLQVADTNESARRVYEGLGFVTRRTMEFVLARPPA